ncbi:MAG: AIPR family protein [Anaerolineales bacterium]|nr:AIPR family protein [Anaerolineales bacterium]
MGRLVIWDIIMPPSLQQFSLIKSHVKHFEDELKLTSENAFYFFVLGLILDLQEDEIKDSITDNQYLAQHLSGRGGHDRGIDAVYIDETGAVPVVHLFNCKYTSKFDKTRNNLPASEIDKILGFVKDLISKELDLKETVNPILASKVQEIWDIFDKHNPEFEIHFCANYYNGFEAQEKTRFEKSVGSYSDFKINYHLMEDLHSRVLQSGKKTVNARLRAIDKNYFEKSDGDIRALIVDVEARELLRIVIDDQGIRNDTDYEDYTKLVNYSILEDAFENNIRIYLKQRSKINRNIKKTALSDTDHFRFFYFNNGITITCDRFTYMKSGRAPIIDLQNLQIVNGSQTIHALYEAFNENPRLFDNIDVLVRIYETQNAELSTRIAEYTNSQNPVKSRDIRSIDYVQQILEAELDALGFYYERKKNQYYYQPREKRIDAEKTGQVLFAFYNKMPLEAKNEKRLIFGEKYEEIFNDEINADKVLLPYRLFEYIEKRKDTKKREMLDTSANFDDDSFILVASYHILYIIGEIATKKNLEFRLSNLSAFQMLYDQAVELVRKLISIEKSSDDKYNHTKFFKSIKPKRLFEEHILSEL